MKYWRGYVVAALFAAVAAGLMWFASAHRNLVDMIYPYVTRLVQTTLAEWSGGVDLCLWQVFLLLLGVGLIASIVVTIVLKWNFVQLVGWVLAAASLIFMLHTGIYGLNTYAGRLDESGNHVGLADDIRLNIADFQTTGLVEATKYYRDQANLCAETLERDENGDAIFSSFEEMAVQAGEGFQKLVYEKSYSVFAGSTAPVKKLGWADWYTAMGITGVTMPLTGEAAVNPNIPAVALPFTMCHEMAHRMCIAVEQDANLAAFLACRENPDLEFRYSGYFMAYIYCYDALIRVGTSAANQAAKEMTTGINPQFRRDLEQYSSFYSKNIDQDASEMADKMNDVYIKLSGDKRGTQSYSEVSVLLVSWHIQEIYLPEHKEEEQVFDPLDKNQVDISGMPGAGK